MYKMIYNGQDGEKAVRDEFAAALAETMRSDPDVVYLDSDLMSSFSTAKLKDEFPGRIINCGIQEGDMISVASGMSAVGKKPFTHTFGVFATRRCFDQVFLSAAYAKNNVRMIGSDEGIAAEYNGGTHMPLEDMALMRAVPGATVIDVTDGAMMAYLVPELAKRDGVYYMRTARKAVPAVYEHGSSFEIGKGNLLREGSDVAIFACGLLVCTALDAAEKLAAEGIKASVVDMFTVKPLDEKLVVELAEKCGAVVTAENHNVIGGLGSAVAETLGEHCPVPMQRIGAREKFGEVGSASYLRGVFGMNVEDVVAAAKDVIARK